MNRNSLLRSLLENVDLIHRGMETLHQVSMKLLDLEKNLTSSFPAVSDELVPVVHLLLVSVHLLRQVSPIRGNTVMTPASHEVVLLRGPSWVALQCSWPKLVVGRSC